MAVKASATITLVRVNDGVSVESVDVMYAISSSSTTPPTSGWQTTAPAWVNGKYMWSKTVTKLSNGDTKESDAACITGAKGTTGTTGATGTGISSITEEYYLSTSKTTQTGGSWTTTPPTWSSGKYIWTRSKIVYKNPASTVYTTPVCDSSWEAVNEVEVGGRNLLLWSNNPNKAKYYDPSKYQIAGYDSSVPLIVGAQYTVQVNVTKTEERNRLRIYVGGDDALFADFAMSKETETYTAIFKMPNHADVKNNYINVYASTTGGPQGSTPISGTCSVNWIKLEIGNKATDWTPAPEDMATAEDAQNAQESADKAQGTADKNSQKIEDLGASLEVLEDSIVSLVVDENGSSLMEQTADGWRFNIGAIQKTISDTAEDLKGLETQVDGVGDLVDKLDGLTQDISEKTAYINLVTTDTGQPCIELGKQGDDFKLRITNTSVDFMDGSDRIAYVSNKTLYIERAIIKDELQIGDGEGFIWKRRSNGNMGLRWISG